MVSAADTDEERELPPDNFYHEQLRRLSAKSPLSTTKFVPPVGPKSGKGSKTGSKTGSRAGSRDSSRERSPTRSRAASPGSPTQGVVNMIMSQRVTSSPFGVSGKAGAGGGAQGDEADQQEAEEEELDDFQRNDNPRSVPQARQQGTGATDSFPMQQSSSLPTLHHSESQINLLPNQPLTQSQTQSRRIPKQEVQPAGTVRLKEKLRSKQQRHNQEELQTFLKHKLVVAAAFSCVNGSYCKSCSSL